MDVPDVTAAVKKAEGKLAFPEPKGGRVGMRARIDGKVLVRGVTVSGA